MVTLEAALAKVPPKVSAALRAKVDKHQADAAAGKIWPLTCLGDDKDKCDPKKVCEAIGKALKAVNEAQTAVGEASVRKLKQELVPLLDQIRIDLCDKSGAQGKQDAVDEVGRLLNTLSVVAGQPNPANLTRLAEMKKLLSRIEWACRECEGQKTPPWFDAGAKCDDKIMMPPNPVVRAEPHLGYVTCSLYYTVCGSPVTETRQESFSMGILNSYSRMKQEEAYEFCASKGYGRNNVPYRPTCCKKWNQAYTDWVAFRRKHGPDAPGQPCNPFSDADCDGTDNRTDPTPLGDCAEYPERPSTTPTASTFRPTLSFFGSGAFTNPILAVLPGFWTKSCGQSELESGR